MIFPDYNVLFTPMSLIFQKEGSTITIDNNNFEILQAALREAFCAKNGPMDQ